jgi:hypothetical protein
VWPWFDEKQMKETVSIQVLDSDAVLLRLMGELVLPSHRSDTLAKALLNLYNRQNKVSELLTFLIESEVGRRCC